MVLRLAPIKPQKEMMANEAPDRYTLGNPACSLWFYYVIQLMLLLPISMYTVSWLLCMYRMQIFVVAGQEDDSKGIYNLYLHVTCFHISPLKRRVLSSYLYATFKKKSFFIYLFYFTFKMKSFLSNYCMSP